ncbi:helix-turn-helix transcriptional regulator [Acinetobacter radioresistens]|uniref:helix-turn-helix transcriptional regulator n=1 Tax=Acinetobacter radioresistens TaxID=40216 RepID=UPI00200613D6|nr:AlpA family phage regulatory protein [Acinetobacter radioresistens]MCK4079838.1 AlpA family phage regulatory protein [Acinetobacter radioresistens]
MMRTETENNLLEAIFNEMQEIKRAFHADEDRLLKTSEVAKMTGITRASIIKMVEDGSFPEPDWVSESGYKRWWKSTIYTFFNKKQALAS